MNKYFLFLSAAALLFASCIKKTNPAAFTPTDLTGKAHIKGNVTKNVITPNGTGGWTSATKIPAKNVNISIRIAKNQLYPNSNAQGSDVYSATTDASGNYDIEVTATGAGVSANVSVEGISATLDTIINGVTKTGLPCLYAGTNANVTAWSGQNTWFNYNMVATNVGTNPNNIIIGSAVISGSVGMNLIRAQVSGTNPVIYSNTFVPVSGQVVYVDFNMDPTWLTVKRYSTTTDANGKFTFNLATVAAGTGGFAQNAIIWAPDLYTSRDTVFVVNGNTVHPFTTGKFGVFTSVQTVENSVFNTEIRNAANLNYNAFNPN